MATANADLLLYFIYFENVWTDCVQIDNKIDSTHDTYLAEISYKSID